MKKNNEPEKAPNHERWLLTYADLITLLVAFFIVLYAMSLMDQKKFTMLAESLTIALGKGTPAMLEIETGKTITSVGQKTSENDATMQQENTMNDIGGFIKENSLEDTMQAEYTANGNIELRLNDSILFDPGKAMLRPNIYDILRKLGTIIKKLDNNVVVEGHTDDLPIRNELYQSNWELSVHRALAVEKFLMNAGDLNPARASIQGFGEFKPISPNISAGNRAKNRRVAIVIVKKQTNEL